MANHPRHPAAYYLRFPCPQCGATQKVLAAQVGTELRCAECPAVIIVPSLEELTAADKTHNHQRKKVGAARKAPAAGAGSEKPAPPPLELNIVRGHVVSFACPVCHHMMRSTAEELGHVIMCPHCYSPVVVGGEHQRRVIPPEETISLVLEDSGEDEYRLSENEPAPQVRRAPPGQPAGNDQAEKQSAAEEEDEYRLSDEAAVERPRQKAPPPLDLNGDLDLDLAPAGETGSKSPRRDRAALEEPDPMDGAWVIQERNDRVRLEDRIAAAAKSQRFNAEPPDHPFVQGVFGFLLYPSTWQRWLALTAGTALMYYLVANAVASGISGGAELFFSLIFAAMAGAAALLLIMFESVAALAIVQDTAAGADEVEGWPDFNFVDWAGQAFYCINALAFSAAPGLLLVTVTESWGPMRWAVAAMSMALFFPVVLLSQLDGMSPFSVLTPGVLKSPFKSPAAWMAFYAVSLLMLAGASGICWLAVRLLAWDGAAVAIVVGVTATTAVLLESRLIGRLAWFCEETPPPAEEVEESEESKAEEDREVIE